MVEVWQNDWRLILDDNHLKRVIWVPCSNWSIKVSLQTIKYQMQPKVEQRFFNFFMFSVAFCIFYLDLFAFISFCLIQALSVPRSYEKISHGWSVWSFSIPSTFFRMCQSNHFIVKLCLWSLKFSKAFLVRLWLCAQRMHRVIKFLIISRALGIKLYIVDINRRRWEAKCRNYSEANIYRNLFAISAFLLFTELNLSL